MRCTFCSKSRDSSPPASKKQRPSKESPELEEGQLPVPPPAARGGSADDERMDVDGAGGGGRSPRSQEARRCACSCSAVSCPQ